MTADTSIAIEKLLPYSVNLLRRVQLSIAHMLAFQPEVALQRISDPRKDPNNQPLRIDYYAEDFYGAGLGQEFKGKICAVGEESLDRRPDLTDITNRKEVFAIMDIIDGTDLLLRRLGNWCSAIVFYYPPKQQILLSLVGDNEGNIFYATHDKPSAYFYSIRSKSLSEAVPLATHTRPNDREEAFIRFARNHPSGPLADAPLCNASVCFVGQKPPHFLAAARNAALCGELDALSKALQSETRPAPAFRIYNLGGIPMMPKVATGLLDAILLLRPVPSWVICTGSR
jgi:hypothetical protein